MTEIDNFKAELQKRLSNEHWGIGLKKAWKTHAEFIEKFPYRENPELIDKLTPDEIYKPGDKVSFLNYIEHKLQPLGHISLGSDRPWRSAREDSGTFRELLRTVVDEQKTLADKIDDAKWESLKGWGADKHYAKKIIFCYFPEDTLPVFKTAQLEGLVGTLSGGDQYKSKATKYGKSYDDLSVGQKYEILTATFMDIKKKHLGDLKGVDNALLMWALSEVYPPSEPVRTNKVTEPLSAVRMLFSPDNELMVVALFSMYHRELGFPYILRIQSAFPDASVIDAKGQIKNIEFELFASSFRDHAHDPSKCDYIVCWYDNMPDEDDLKPKVLCLQQKLGSEDEEE